jgi:hypothetical protein
MVDGSEFDQEISTTHDTGEKDRITENTFARDWNLAL